MKKWGREVLVNTCIFYTAVSLIGGYINAVADGEWKFYANLVMMFVWTGIAVAVLYAHTLFERWPPALVMVVQYIVAMGLVFLVMWITGRFVELHPLWRWHVFRSFTIPYIVGAAAFYVETFRKARKTNDLLAKARGRAAR